MSPLVYRFLRCWLGGFVRVVSPLVSTYTVSCNHICSREDNYVSHMVIFQAPGGSPGYNQFESLEAAIAFVEQLRNDRDVSNARIFALEEVKFEMKPYFKVELQALTTSTGGSSNAPSGSGGAGAPTQPADQGRAPTTPSAPASGAAPSSGNAPSPGAAPGSGPAPSAPSSPGPSPSPAPSSAPGPSQAPAPAPPSQGAPPPAPPQPSAPSPQPDSGGEDHGSKEPPARRGLFGR